MANYDGFVENFNLINCYVDTSYYDMGYYSDTIITSKFSNEDAQTEIIRNYLVVVANQGFKLKQEFSFKYDKLEITQDNFKPLTNELNLNIDITTTDFQLSGVNLANSLVYETTINDKQYYIFLLGGFNEYKLIFGIYGKAGVYYDGTYGEYKFRKSDLTDYLFDDEGFPLGNKSLLNDLMFTAGSEEELEPDINNNFFTTYYVNIDTLREIKHKGTVSESLIINTYSYPIKFKEEQLIETTIKTGYISSEVIANVFKKNYSTLDIFKFTVPDISDVTECYVKIPFNNDVNLNYEDVKGKTICGYITYEVLTNSTTLFITDEEKILYKNIITIGVEIPFKPTGKLDNFKDVKSRLAFEEPKLYIKGVGKSVKGNYLKGFIREPKKILKDELDLLNNFLNDGVFVNDENN